PTSHDNIVAGNFIGATSTGLNALGNTGPGVLINTGAHNNLVGGASGQPRNTIVENTVGVLIDGSGPLAAANNQIDGNHIGLDVCGGSAVPNATGGIRILNSPA